jgi:hypothetical protein
LQWTPTDTGRIYDKAGNNWANAPWDVNTTGLVPYSPSGNTYSIATRIRVDGFPSDTVRAAFTLHNAANTTVVDSLNIWLNGRVQFKSLGSGTTYTSCVTDNSINANQWYTLVATYDGLQQATGINIYFDGVLKSHLAGNDYNGSGELAAPGKWVLAGNAFNTGNDLNCTIAWAAIFKGVLNQTQVTALSNTSNVVWEER